MLGLNGKIAGLALIGAALLAGHAQADVQVDLSVIGLGHDRPALAPQNNGQCSSLSNAPHRQLPFNTPSGPVVVPCDNSSILPRTRVGQPSSLPSSARAGASADRIVLTRPGTTPPRSSGPANRIVLTPPGTSNQSVRRIEVAPARPSAPAVQVARPAPAVQTPRPAPAPAVQVARPAPAPAPIPSPAPAPTTRPATQTALVTPQAPATVEAPARTITRPEPAATPSALTPAAPAMTRPAPAPKPAAAQPTPAPAPAPAPTPTPAPAATPAPAPTTQVAAVTTPATLPSGVRRITFDGGDTDIDPAGVALLRSIAAEVRDTNQRVEVEAFADDPNETNVWKRRVSLRRAQAVRGVLLDQGVESFRILVRARGEPGPDRPGPGNRVDIVVKSR